jgi:hypothetical protein
VDTDVKHCRGTRGAEAPCELGESPDPRVKAFLDALATTAAKQLLHQLEAAESETTEETE